MSETENQRAGDERVSMWSVPRRFRRVYFQLFYSLGIIGISWSVWYEASRLGNGASYHDLANTVIQKAPAIIFTTAFISLMTTEVSMVLAEMVSEYFQKRRDAAAAEAQAKGKAEGLAEGLAEGREKGLAEGAEIMAASGRNGIGSGWKPKSGARISTSRLRVRTSIMGRTTISHLSNPVLLLTTRQNKSPLFVDIREEGIFVLLSD